MDFLDKLVSCLGKLPGVGRRSAERMAIRLVRDPNGMLSDLIAALKNASETIRCCSLCGSITTIDREPCKLCTGQDRDGTILCVVEDPGDIAIIERSGGFHGRYHALMGKISPGRGSGPADLRIDSLLERIEKEKFKEVMLALSTDVEGDSTASYIAELLKDKNIRISRLASGLPAGSGIVYSDPITLARAIKGRTIEK
jgi:recombination protein RecR